jgi:hypothetical protein
MPILKIWERPKINAVDSAGCVGTSRLRFIVCLDIGSERKFAVFGVIKRLVSENIMGTEIWRDAAFGWKVVQAFGGDHGEISEHDLGDHRIREVMVCRSDALLDGSVVSLGLGNVFGGGGVVHDDIQLIRNGVHDWSKLLITVDQFDIEPAFPIDSINIINTVKHSSRTPVVQCEECAEADRTVDAGQHRHPVNKHNIDAKGEIPMHVLQFLWDIDLVSSHCHGDFLVDLPFSVPISGPKILSAVETSPIVTGQFLMMFWRRMCLKFTTVGQPRVWYSFLALFALSNSRSILFSSTESTKKLSPFSPSHGTLSSEKPC